MRVLFLSFLLLGGVLACASSASPQSDPGKAGLDAAKLAPLRGKMQEYADQFQAAGIVTCVGRKGVMAHLEAVGWRDLEKKDAMKTDTLFRIASMTKPITGIAIMMCEDDGKLSVEDPVEKHLPEFKGQMLVKSKSGNEVTLVKPPRPITLRDLLTHTSGLPGGPPPGLSDLYAKRNHTLAEAVMAFSQRPLDFEPGTKWAYCNAGIDTLGRVVEVCSGKPFEAFLQERLFGPLGMKDTAFYPTAESLARTAELYQKDGAKLKRIESFIGDCPNGKFPLPAGGLYSTAADLAKVYQMMLDGGMSGGRRILSSASAEKMTTLQSGEIKTGFVDGMGWGFGFAVVREPKGVTEMLSPGSYGHGGAFGTQGWIDPKKGMYFILMVQRAGFPNGDASDLRKTLQSVAVAAINE